MTLGEKIRYARKSCCLSQEQLAEKLCVSRSAIAKWETDKGLPDIENLKLLSRVLGVSVDSLLQEDDPALRESCHLAPYGRGCKKVRKDRFMCHRFPGARICTLLGRPPLENSSGTLDSTLGFLTPMPFGAPEYVKSVRSMEKDFYLVEQADIRLFVAVGEDYLQMRPAPDMQEGTFTIAGWTFIRGNYLAEE